MHSAREMSRITKTATRCIFVSAFRCKANTVVPAVTTKRCVRRSLTTSDETTYPGRGMTMRDAWSCRAMRGATTTARVVHRNNDMSIVL